MSFIPAFELGLWNAWILMIWLVLLPILPKFIIKDKKTLKQLRTSVPVKYEKALNVISTVAVIFGFIYSIFLPIKYGAIWFYIGGLIFLIGIISVFSIFATLRNSSVNKPFTKGLYRYSRHPLYISTSLILLSVTIISLSWVFLVLLAIVIVHMLISAPAEEKFCLEKYGEDYRIYLKKTPRWIGIPNK